MSATTDTTTPCTDFLAWRAAVDAAAALRAPLVGRRVQRVSRFVDDYVGPKGWIKDVTASGFKVSWEVPDDRQGRRIEMAHPDDVVFI
ncbi:hypothetical protein [Arthrobacter glacialis]|uniref:hypothetical protein n=1 Tax=Arthrobacter glacialis TaxID=1664 RepID=UPI000CD49129|nr:hypothetical protein [Arthrobacter glacialis]POH58934.1 hypothetical protein CVS28_09515 [Arthrobacter glacialis]